MKKIATFFSTILLMLSSCQSTKLGRDFKSLSLKFNNFNEGLTVIKGMEYSYSSEEVPLNKTSEEIVDIIETILNKAQYFYTEGKDANALGKALKYQCTDSKKVFIIEDAMTLDLNELKVDFISQPDYYLQVHSNLFASNDKYLDENKNRLDLYANLSSKSDYDLYKSIFN